MRSINETLAVRSRLSGVLRSMIRQKHAPLSIEDPLNAGAPNPHMVITLV